MADLFKPLKKKVDNIIINLLVTGLLIMLLGVLMVWTDFLLRLVAGTVTIAIAYIFFYLAYRLYTIKKDLENYFKF